MHQIKDRIEGKFAAARLFYRHHFITLLVLALLSRALFSQIPQLTLDTSAEGFLHEKDPVLLAYNEFRKQFGSADMIIVAIQSKDISDCYGFRGGYIR